MEYVFSDKVASLKPSAIREIFKYLTDPEVIALSAGNPAGESFPVGELSALSAELWRDSAVAALQYSVTEGYAPLREKVKNRLKSKFGIGGENDDVIIVTGGQQGIDLTAKVLCNEGDTIICEAPSFIGSLNSFRAYNTRLVGIDMDEDGMNIEQLERALGREKNVKLLYIISSFQNPTGKCTSFEKRKKIYELCVKHNVIILEDNPYGELRFSGEDIPTIKSLDTEGIVVYDGSFSKILSPGMRLGFVCGPKEIVQKIVVAKQANDVHTNILCQRLADMFLEKCDLDAHIEKIRAIYRRKSRLMMDEMDRLFDGTGVTHTVPEGGLFLWCALPDNIDGMDFAARAIQNKVAVVPGSAFMVDESRRSCAFRVTYATPTEEQIVEGVRRLAETVASFG